MQHVEFDLEMYNSLNKIDWRRIDVGFEVEYKYQIICLHDLIVCKPFKIPFICSNEQWSCSQLLLKKIQKIIETDLL
jgi:hypothetical protein